jgi:hypothetical protein
LNHHELLFQGISLIFLNDAADRQFCYKELREKRLIGLGFIVDIERERDLTHIHTRVKNEEILSIKKKGRMKKVGFCKPL